MTNSWIFLCGIAIFTCPVQGTFRYEPAVCECNGKSQYCVADSLGLHCLECQGDTAGRHCERCKEGFYHQRSGESCLPCHCSPSGSVSPVCDRRGLCTCKPGIQGHKCDRCPDGTPVTPNGCAQSDQFAENLETFHSCFCYGHSSECSFAKGYSVHTITSMFDGGPEGWRVATATGVTPSQVHFRWSPTHRDLEVISEESTPIYFFAPRPYLGSQELSYGQNLSFSLRLDRGVRRPSTEDVVLEGAGLRVGASLGDLRTVLPCGQKMNFSFRLDEQPDSKWRPYLSPFQFQTLLQNLTAIKIRGTFGENGRGYLDNVRLVSARVGTGAPATWVQKCSCPQGYEGSFCESCAAGYKRQTPSKGSLSSCEPCACRGGSCDPETGDCYSADETPAQQTCSAGYYANPAGSQSCVKCPCPLGTLCYLIPGTSGVQCEACPPGSTGSRCQTCNDGFYGDPLGENGPQQPCQPCQCNGHMDPNALGNCDRLTGECLKCLNNTRGFYCEDCLEGFYHGEPSQACKPCNCNLLGSLSNKCSDKGQCLCKEGFEGQRCDRSACPSCFTPVKTKMERYSRKLLEIEALLSGMGSGSSTGSGAQVEKVVRTYEDLVKEMQGSAKRLTDSEKSLEAQLSDITKAQSTEGRDMQAISKTVDNIKVKEARYQQQASLVQQLINDIRSKLEEARRNVKKAEFPSGDAEAGTDTLSSLVQRATDLAEKHQDKAATVEKTAKGALSEAEKTLALMRSVMTGENKVKELIDDLKTKYEADSAQVKTMENQALRLNSAAGEESKMAADTLKQISSLKIPGPINEIEGLVTQFDNLKKWVNKNLTDCQALQKNIQGEKVKVEDILAKGQTDQQLTNQLLARVNKAKAKTEEALKDIGNNMDGVDDALKKLKGFDDQIGNNKALADVALKKLPGINATIQQAVGNNGKTQFILDGVEGDYNKALGTVGKLGDVVSRMEALSDPLSVPSDLMRGATKLKNDLKGLKSQAGAAMENLRAEVDKAEQQNDRAKGASTEATGAYGEAKKAKGAIGETLLAVNNLLSSFGQPGTVDDKRLRELEKSISDTRNQVNQQVRPRLQDMDGTEARQRARIAQLDADIDKILDDIDNLKEIQRTIPKGCFNSPPIERP